MQAAGAGGFAVSASPGLATIRSWPMGADLVVATLDDVIPARARRRPTAGTAGHRGDPAAIHRAAARRLDAGV